MNDASAAPIDELRFAATLNVALPQSRELTRDERKGASAEIQAWRFHPFDSAATIPGRCTGRS